MTSPPIIDPRQIAALKANAALTPPAPVPVAHMAMPSPLPQMGAAPTPLVVRTPTQTETDTAKLNDMVSKGAGVAQIGNPVLRGIARAGDIAGQVASAAFPALRVALSAVPGTTERHDFLVHQMRNTVANDNANDLATAQTADAQAQASQRQSLATQEQAKAAALLNPQTKSQPGAIITGPDGYAVGYRDDDGTTLSLHNPKVSQDVREVASLMAPKPEKVAPGDKPIDAIEAAAHNAAYDPILPKHNIPTGQFKPGMTRAEVTSIQNGLNQSLQRQQGDTRIVVQQAGQQQRAKAALTHTGAIDLSSPESQQAIAAGARGEIGLNELLPRGATFGQRAALVAAMKQVNPDYNSGDHAIENNVRRYMTSGQGGTTLAAGNTLTHHLDLYDKAVDAVHNGDVKAINKIGNELGVQVGNDAQTNLSLIRQGVAMEAARFYTGGVPGEKEIDHFEQNLSGDGSPQQMHGGANTVRGMAAGRLASLKAQSQTGTQGKANFAGSSPSGGGQAEEWVRDSNGKLVKK